MSEERELPERRGPAPLLIEISEVEDRIEVLEKERDRRTWAMIWLGLLALVFFALGAGLGNVGFHVVAAFVTVYQIVPLGRRMEVSVQLRRAESELHRLLEAGDSVGDPEPDA